MYSKILCPIDGSEVSDRGIHEAVQLARGQNASVKFLHILDLGPLVQYPLGEEALAAVRQVAQSIVDDALKAAHQQGVHAEGVVKEVVQGRVGPAIVAHEEQFVPDLIVMGTHGRRGMSRLLLGSDAALVAREAKTPVLLVK